MIAYARPTHWECVTIAALALCACAPGDGAGDGDGDGAGPTSGLGAWRVAGYEQPGITALSPAEAQRWVGLEATFADTLATLGAYACAAPRYSTGTVDAADFLADYRVAATTLGLGDPVTITRVDCGDGSTWPGSTLLHRAGARLALWDGTYFVLEASSGEGASSPIGASVDTPAAGVDLSPVACEGLEASILAAAPTRAAFRERFGAPDSMAASTEPNRHVEGATDSLFTAFYPGMIASFRTPAGGGDLATTIEITDPRYVRYPALAMGAPAAQVTTVLGEPTRREDDALVYDCALGAEQPVRFLLRDGVVETIRIEFYVD
jgi:hypothetical protein